MGPKVITTPYYSMYHASATSQRTVLSKHSLAIIKINRVGEKIRAGPAWPKNLEFISCPVPSSSLAKNL